MGDSDDKPASPGIPAWQRHSEPDDKATPSQPPDPLHAARRFLDDDEVQAASRASKADFLKSKGLQDGDIEQLLRKGEDQTGASAAGQTVDAAATRAQREAPHSSTWSPSGSDRPPIITYPEFLAKPERPPPLATTHALLNTLYAFAGLSTLLYGTSKYLVAPMVGALTDARTDLYGAASKRLDVLVSKLEKMLSEHPQSKAQPVGAYHASDAHDPTDIFHRHAGTQTYLPAGSDAALAKDLADGESRRQADRLSPVTSTLSELKDQLRAHNQNLQDISTLLHVFRHDLDAMTYTSQTQFVGGFDMYSKRSEPEDELRNVRDSIRRVKGVLLSTRSFPASTAR